MKKKLFLFLFLSFCSVAYSDNYLNNFVENYDSVGNEIPIENLQCPIPKKDRVKNYTGVQCVYSSIEMLGRWAEEPKLANPPITSRMECKGYSGPSRAADILNKLEVKFEQSYGNKEKGRMLLQKAMKEGRGALWGVPGHAMVIVHYDLKENKVCWVDNSDRTLKVQEMTVDKFEKKWDSWILVIYADNDIIPKKIKIFNMSILNIDNSIKKSQKGFIPFPSLNFWQKDLATFF